MNSISISRRKFAQLLGAGAAFAALIVTALWLSVAGQTRSAQEEVTLHNLDILLGKLKTVYRHAVEDHHFAAAARAMTSSAAKPATSENVDAWSVIVAGESSSAGAGVTKAKRPSGEKAGSESHCPSDSRSRRSPVAVSGSLVFAVAQRQSSEKVSPELLYTIGTVASIARAPLLNSPVERLASCGGGPVRFPQRLSSCGGEPEQLPHND